MDGLSFRESLNKPARRLPQLASGQWNDGMPPEAMIDILAQSAVALLYLRATYQYDPLRDQARSN